MHHNYVVKKKDKRGKIADIWQIIWQGVQKALYLN